MINLSRHIEYELLYHDIVVIPQFGTFKATYVPSKWIEEEELLLPPYRALSFTQEVNNKDTRFVETISTSYQISIEEANIVTLEFTENIQQELSEYGSFELGSIGEFVLDEATGKIRFIACQAGAASPWLYGLDAIHVHPSKENIIAVSQKKDKNTSDKDAKKITISINKRILHYVTTVAASIILFFAFSTPVSENSLNQNPEMRSELFLPPTSISKNQPKTTKGVENVDKTTTTKKDIDSGVILDKKIAQQEQAEIAHPSFSVVLCCGVPAQNAEAYCQNLNERGIKATVDKSGKFIRVLIPGFETREDALAEIHSLRSISKEFSNAWIMEK